VPGESNSKLVKLRLSTGKSSTYFWLNSMSTSGAVGFQLRNFAGNFDGLRKPSQLATERRASQPSRRLPATLGMSVAFESRSLDVYPVAVGNQVSDGKNCRCRCWLFRTRYFFPIEVTVTLAPAHGIALAVGDGAQDAAENGLS